MSTKADTSETSTRPWWKDVVAYEIWPKSFKDSTGDGHGDIQGIISKLDYLKDLGVDLIWICPTYKSPEKDFGYDISDYNDINPAFGTLKDMEQLISEVHQRGMRILLDLVVTHTSDQHPWFLESKSSRGNAKHDWYIWKERRPGHTVANSVSGKLDLVEEPTNWKACFGGSAWTHVEERDQFYVHLFLAQEPDLNWENPETRKAVFDAAIGFWLDKGVDGFRIDTVNRISKNFTVPDAPTKLAGKLQPGSDFYINGPQSHFYLKEMRKYMDNHPRVKEGGHDLMLVGELPRTPYDDVLRYTHPDSRELSMVFDFDMVKLGGHDNPDEVGPHQVKNLCDDDPSFTLPQFKFELQKVQNLIASGAWGTVFMENHDQCRSINRYATPDPKYYNTAGKLLALLQTTLSGTQFIYQGQEMGMKDMPMHWDYYDFRDPAALTFLRDQFALGPEAYENGRIGNLKFGRDNSRTPVQWTGGKNAGFSDCKEGETWMGVNENKDAINLEDQMVDEDSIWCFWKKAIAMRKQHCEVFMHGSFEILNMEDTKSFTYLKTSVSGETAIVCLNFSDQEQPLYLPQTVLESKGRTLEFIIGNLGKPSNLHLPLQAWEGRAYFLKSYAGIGDCSGLTGFSATTIADATASKRDDLSIIAALNRLVDMRKGRRSNDRSLSTIFTTVLAACKKAHNGVVSDVPIGTALEATEKLKYSGTVDAAECEALEADLMILKSRLGYGAPLDAYLDIMQDLKEIYGDEEVPVSAVVDATAHLKPDGKKGLTF